MNAVQELKLPLLVELENSLACSLRLVGKEDYRDHLHGSEKVCIDTLEVFSLIFLEGIDTCPSQTTSLS